MAIHVEKSGALTFVREADEALRQKPKSNLDMGLFLVLVVLVAWALYFSLGTLGLPMISHAFRGLMAAIW